MIEGGSSRNYVRTKKLMYGAPELWDGLMRKLVDMTTRYLGGQIEAGADAVQIFDSWAGALSPGDYRRSSFLTCARSSCVFNQRACRSSSSARERPDLLDQLAATGADVVGLDWRVNLDQGWERVGFDRAIQGNLDPVLALRAAG